MGVAYNIIEPDFKRDQGSAYQLSILIGMDSLVYSVYVQSTGQLLLLKSHPLVIGPADNDARSVKALEDFLAKEDLLKAEYGTVKIAFASPVATLVPARLFNENESDTYLSELVTDPVKEQVLVDEVLPLKAKVVYQVGKQLLELLQDKFPSAAFFHSSTPFLVGCLKVPVPESVPEAAFACFANDTFQLAVFQKEELLLYNRYDCKSASDVLYFILLAYEQYGLSPNTAPLYLSGKVVNDSDIYKLLYRYVANLHIQPPPSSVQFGAAASSLDPNFFFPLHSLLLCE